MATKPKQGKNSETKKLGEGKNIAIFSLAATTKNVAAVEIAAEYATRF